MDRQEGALIEFDRNVALATGEALGSLATPQVGEVVYHDPLSGRAVISTGDRFNTGHPHSGFAPVEDLDGISMKYDN